MFFIIQISSWKGTFSKLFTQLFIWQITRWNDFNLNHVHLTVLRFPLKQELNSRQYELLRLQTFNHAYMLKWRDEFCAQNCNYGSYMALMIISDESHWILFHRESEKKSSGDDVLQCLYLSGSPSAWLFVANNYTQHLISRYCSFVWGNCLETWGNI